MAPGIIASLVLVGLPMGACVLLLVVLVVKVAIEIWRD